MLLTRNAVFIFSVGAASYFTQAPALADLSRKEGNELVLAAAVFAL